MSRHMITIRGPSDREQAARWSMHAKEGMRIEFKQAKRSGEQNDKLWAMLTEVAVQVPWHGIKLAPDDWKFIFLDALKRELRVVPNIDGTGFVNLGRSSSDLSKSEMSDLIELVHEFGARNNVMFKETDVQPAAGNKTSPLRSMASDQEQVNTGSGEVHDRMSESTSPTNSNSVEPDAPQAQTQPSEPAAVGNVPPTDTAAGNPSQSSAPPPVDEEAQASEASSAGLPSGWGILYASALRRAQKPDSLKKYAVQFWASYGGFDAHKNGPDGPTAIAIYDAFTANFGRPELVEAALREII